MTDPSTPGDTMIIAPPPAWQRHCDCRCRVHHRQIRDTYDDPGCTCTITCNTQPLTLLADRWGCALFLDNAGNLWQVPAAANLGTWNWEDAGEVDTRHDYYHASVVIEHLLRASAHLLANPGS
jgi:hypothetical protein